MDNPLQYLQNPGEVLAGATTFVALIILLLRGEKERQVKLVCVGVIATGILLITENGATASSTSVGIDAWFALLALITGLSSLFLIYKVWSLADWLDMSLLGVASMSFLTLACELYLTGHSDHSRWTGAIRRFPAVSLWVAALLILLAVVLVGVECWSAFRAYRRKLRNDSNRPSK